MAVGHMVEEHMAEGHVVEEHMAAGHRVEAHLTNEQLVAKPSIPIHYSFDF
jgi:(2Fe-2S) ferredoxin